MIDPTLDLSILIQKNVSLLCEKALIKESFFEQSLSLLDEILIFLLFPMISACCLILWN